MAHGGPVLKAAGDQGMSFGAACAAMDAAGKLDSPDRALALATGHAGDVYLCHPFLIHAAQPHRGREPRFMAQPPLNLFAPLELRRADGAYSPWNWRYSAASGPRPTTQTRARADRNDEMLTL